VNNKKVVNLKNCIYIYIYIYIYILHYNIRVISNRTINVDFVAIKMYLFLYYRTILLDLILYN